MPTPLPTSGPINFSEIANYLGFGGTDNSLRSMSSEAGFSTPDSVSEFYGYGSLPEVNWGYDSKGYDGACSAGTSVYYADDPSPALASAVYTDAAGTTPALAGWYSDFTSARYFDGSSFTGFAEFC
jgi:hypothetical protein